MDVSERLLGGWNLSMAGCGFRSVYHLGALRCFLDHTPELVHGASRVGGASSGCLVAAAVAVGIPIGTHAHSFTHSLTHSQTHSLTYSQTHSLTHSHTHIPFSHTHSHTVNTACQHWIFLSLLSMLNLTPGVDISSQ